MENYQRFVLLVLISVVLWDSGFCARTSTKIYYNVEKDSTAMCFRRFNATHQIGCSSDRNGNVGVVYYASNSSSIDRMISSTTSLRFILLLNMDLFSKYALKLIKNSRKVRGIVILNINDTELYIPDSFSPDRQCPNEAYGITLPSRISDVRVAGDTESCKSTQWNTKGTGLMFEDYPFPVITLQNASVAEFLKTECYENHNSQVLDDWSADSHLCGMLIKDVMDGAKDTPTCMRRSNLQISLSPQHYCEPLSNKNVFSSLRPIIANETKSVVIVAARLDSFSLFDKLAPGFESAVVSYVTLYAVAEAIGVVKQQLNNADTHILFVLFHGEAFDYIGSSRMVYDLVNGEMNFNISDIKLFIEIGQVGIHETHQELYAHTRNGTQEFVITTVNSAPALKAIKIMQDVEQTLCPIHGDIEWYAAFADFLKRLESMLKIREVNQVALPPASLQSFLKEQPSIAGVVIANHNTSFTNKYYNSMYDKPQFAGLDYPSSLNDSEKYNYVGKLASHIQNISTAIAQAVFSFVNKSVEAPVECASNNVTIANMLFCYAVNASCELFNSSFTNSCAANLKREENVQQRYVGVGHGRTQDYCNVYMLARLLGDVVPGNNWTQKTCENLTNSLQDGYLHYFVRGDVSNASDPLMARQGRCIKTMANVSEALSPAFIIDNYNWNSSSYSSWTESVWDEDALKVKIFLIPSQNQEVKTLIVGITLLVFSFVLVFFLKRKASILFPPTPSA